MHLAVVAPVQAFGYRFVDCLSLCPSDGVTTFFFISMYDFPHSNEEKIFSCAPEVRRGCFLLRSIPQEWRCVQVEGCAFCLNDS